MDEFRLRRWLGFGRVRYSVMDRSLGWTGELGLCGRLYSWLGLGDRVHIWQGLGSGFRHHLDLNFGLSNRLRCRWCIWQGFGLWICLYLNFGLSTWQGLGLELWNCWYLDLDLGPRLSSWLSHRCRLNSFWLSLAWALMHWLGLARPGLWCGLCLVFGFNSWLGYRYGLYS